MKKIFLLVVIALLGGCAANPLQPGAEKVRITRTDPQGCEYLGEATGHQGGSFVGGFTSNENMESGARNDLKNKAFALGGNVVVILTDRAGQTGNYNRDFGGSSQQTNVTLSGAVYRCPKK